MTTERTQISATIRKDLADRLDEEADVRIVSKSLIVEKAVEAYLDALVPIEETLAVQRDLDTTRIPGRPVGGKLPARDMGDVENPEGT